MENENQLEDKEVSKDIEQNIVWWKQRFSNCADIKMREMYLGKQMDVKAFLSYIEITGGKFCVQNPRYAWTSEDREEGGREPV